METEHISLKVGQKYKQVVYPNTYDIEYLNNVEVVKETPKSYMCFEWKTGKTYKVPKDGIFEARVLED